MKNRTLLRTSVAIIAGGFFAAAALAGPGPQYRNGTASKPAPFTMDEHPTSQCGGCKTSPIRVVGDRGPAGKGVGLRVSGYSHSCSGCSVTMTAENGKAKSDMKHAAGCAKLVCCK